MGRKKVDNDFRITQYQPTNEVTGSAVLVEVDGLAILLDYGGFQSNAHDIEKVYSINREKMRLPLDRITHTVLSHSHADHVSSLGILGREDIDYNGTVYSTELCAELMREILWDSAHIMGCETELYNRMNPTKKKLQPLYVKDDVDRVMNIVRCYGYEETVWLNDKVSMEFLPSAHLPSSSMIYITYHKSEHQKKTLLYTGDFYYGNSPRPFTKKVLKKCLKANVVITESTYGNRIHSKENPMEVLEKHIKDECLGKNRILFIPCFGQHRSTVVCHYLYEIFKRNPKMKERIPVYFCSKLLSECHQIIGKPQYKEFYDEEWQEMDYLFNNSGFTFIKQGLDVQKILNNQMKIVVASSGMMTGGFSNMIAKSYLPNTKASVLLTGYQGEGTLGRILLEGETKQVVIDGVGTTIRCKTLGTIPNMSCHADLNGIVAFIKSLNQHTLKKVLIHHGGEEERENLKLELEKTLNDRVEVEIFNQYNKVKF